MANFDTDFAAADSLLAEAFGDTVTLSRGSETASVTAELVMRDVQARDRSGFVTTVQTTDFLIAAADYDFGDGAVEPRRGDRIEITIADVAHTFEAKPQGDRPEAEWADASATQWLVHTKHVSP